VSDIVRGLAREMSRGEEEKVRYAAGKASFVSGVDRHARTDGRLAVTSEFWDNDSMLLGTPKGTVDLISGRLRPSAQDEGITKLTAVAPADTADCPIWLSFLNDATGGDKEMIRFLQQWCGYCLTGDVSEHAFVFLYGGGGNGKSVFLNTVSRIVGDYHAMAPMETFTVSSGDRHPTDLAGLRGARLVAASDPNRLRTCTSTSTCSPQAVTRCFVSSLKSYPAPAAQPWDHKSYTQDADTRRLHHLRARHDRQARKRIRFQLLGMPG
jgi:putative DNA primase/helicase